MSEEPQDPSPPYDLSSIGPDQMVNLLRGQVTFAYVPLGPGLREHVQVMWRMALDRFCIPTGTDAGTHTDANTKSSESSESTLPTEVAINEIKNKTDAIVAGFAERNIPIDFGIVVVCADGVWSQKIREELVARGYVNSLFLKGGVQAFTQSTRNF